jgi:hypothetical protein
MSAKTTTCALSGLSSEIKKRISTVIDENIEWLLLRLALVNRKIIDYSIDASYTSFSDLIDRGHLSNLEVNRLSDVFIDINRIDLVEKINKILDDDRESVRVAVDLMHRLNEHKPLMDAPKEVTEEKDDAYQDQSTRFPADVLYVNKGDRCIICLTNVARIRICVMCDCSKICKSCALGEYSGRETRNKKCPTCKNPVIPPKYQIVLPIV